MSHKRLTRTIWVLEPHNMQVHLWGVNMGSIFRNPLVLAETVVGSMIDQRSVVLYEQTELDETKTELEKMFEGTMLYPTIEDFVRKRALTELFTGTEIPYLSEINGFNMWGISYMNAEVNITSDLCDHPIETGQVITDSSIENPITATVNIVMPTAFYTKIYEQVLDYYKNKKKIILLTKFGMYKNMVIKSMPYKLQHGDIDRPAIALTLRQIMEVQPTYESMNINANTQITPEKSLSGEDTDMQIIGQKRYITTAAESMRG